MTMIAKSVLRILVLTIAVAMVLAIAGCSEPVEEADVVGTYVKDHEQPVTLRGGTTTIRLEGSEGKVSLELREGGVAQIEGVGSGLPWRLEDGRVTLYFVLGSINASSSGKFKGDKIVGLGGEGMIWTKK